ncbi:Uncharacterised protein [uncultured Clostridium sp.]|nr:Uncharacterised protein [uncultured Clostridium sp.]
MRRRKRQSRTCNGTVKGSWKQEKEVKNFLSKYECSLIFGKVHWNIGEKPL